MVRDDPAEFAGRWYDLITRGNGSPERREAYIRTALSLRSSGREEPKPRPLSQASLDAQPAKKRQARHDRMVREAKMIAASPLRADAGRPIKDQADAGHLPLFVAASEPGLPL